MFLRYTTRNKNGKEHRYYSLVENRRVASGRVVQRHALYLGEINDRQEAAWRKTIELFEEGQAHPRTVRIPTLSDTCSNSCRTAFQSCRTVIGAKRRAG